MVVGSTVLEHLTHNFQIKGLNLTTGIGREKRAWDLYECAYHAVPSNTAKLDMKYYPPNNFYVVSHYILRCLLYFNRNSKQASK